MSGVIEAVSRKGISGGQLEPPVIVNPLEYPQWDALLANHPEASFFHGAAWPRVLRETYGYNPVYFCRFSGGQLKQLLPVMEVSSPWSGRRGVSLPFADGCSPLTTGEEDLSALYAFAIEHGRSRNWRYFETRGCFSQWPGATPSVSFFGHVLHLESGETALAEGLDGATRRGIHKAEQEGVRVEFGNTLEFIRIFYALHCGAQRRQGLPLQPASFFENIARHVLESGRGFVAVARREQQPLAAGVFFHEGRSAIYKFGASDRAFQHLRPNNLLMWETIKHCAGGGFVELNLGRTSLLNDGLRHFKLGFGAFEQRLEYARYDLRRRVFVKNVDRAEGTLNNALRCLPLPLLRLAGKFYAAV
jgi:hypothetical protein